MFTMMAQEHANSTPEYRQVENPSFVEKMGKNCGFFKVQLINEFGDIELEWKA